MAFDWKEYLNLARFLQGQGNPFTQESAFRCAVSRAYFAAFCHARNYARDRHGFSPTYTGNDHRLVREHFRKRKEAGIAFKLDRLVQWRGKCDYDDTVSDLSRLLTSAIDEAQKVLNILK
jgi:hypothetical protein